MKKIISFLLMIIIVFIIGIKVFAYQINNDNYSMNEDLIEQISSKIPNYTKLDELPEDLKNAVVAVEDRRFYKHHGFDIKAIGRAFITNIKERQVKQGGSTITQQLAKNLFLSNERKFNRKLKELVLAVELENKYTKDEILEMYLNVIYYGSGAYGIQNASLTYFDKNVWNLSLEECAMLAGLPQAPSAYNPKKYFRRAKKRQETVLDIMVKHGFVNNEIKEKTKNQLISIVQ
jgi:membrane peptidoglycan carboxypeptidase